jgi:hypothetical protein
MAQSATARYIEVHPSELIEVSGTTEAGRQVTIYIPTSMAKKLAQAVALLPEAKHLGHAFWHVKNPDWPAGEACSSCQAHSDRSAFEPEGGWTKEA